MKLMLVVVMVATHRMKSFRGLIPAWEGATADVGIAFVDSMSLPSSLLDEFRASERMAPKRRWRSEAAVFPSSRPVRSTVDGALFPPVSANSGPTLPDSGREATAT
jgi:hypothetical protein